MSTTPKPLPDPKRPLEMMSYWISWGGDSVFDLGKYAFTDHLGSDLTGKTVLDLGFGRGRMSALFALLGAQVKGVEMDTSLKPIAEKEIQKWNVEKQIELILYDGDPDLFPDQSFDIIWTKSVLLLIYDLKPFLQKLSRKLKPGGKIAFLENGYHNPLDILCRRLVHVYRRQYCWQLPQYLNDERMAIFKEVFDVQKVEKRQNPHWRLILGQKRK